VHCCYTLSAREFGHRTDRIRANSVNSCTLTGVIPRLIEPIVAERLHAGGKVSVIYGPRQVGKTTLVNQVLSGTNYRVRVVNADELFFRDVLSGQDARQLRDLVEGYDVLFIDEAQRVTNIGINLKIIADQMHDVRVIAAGSSSLDLADKVREPLTGRAWTFTLYPIAQCELARQHSAMDLRLSTARAPGLRQLSGYLLTGRRTLEARLPAGDRFGLPL